MNTISITYTLSLNSNTVFFNCFHSRTCILHIMIVLFIAEKEVDELIEELLNPVSEEGKSSLFS